MTKPHVFKRGDLAVVDLIPQGQNPKGKEYSQAAWGCWYTQGLRLKHAVLTEENVFDEVARAIHVDVPHCKVHGHIAEVLAVRYEYQKVIYIPSLDLYSIGIAIKPI